MTNEADFIVEVRQQHGTVWVPISAAYWSWLQKQNADFASPDDFKTAEKQLRDTGECLFLCWQLVVLP